MSRFVRLQFNDDYILVIDPNEIVSIEYECGLINMITRTDNVFEFQCNKSDAGIIIDTLTQGDYISLEKLSNEVHKQAKVFSFPTEQETIEPMPTTTLPRVLHNSNEDK